MQHLNEEELVLHHYHDGEGAAAVEQHLASCDECRAQFNTLRRVLALVDEMPVPERGDDYSGEIWSRLRWKLGSDRRRRVRWQSALAAAAVLALAFFAGQLWHARNSATAPAGRIAGATQSASIAQQQASHDRLLLIVVSDHLDSSERMLTELANADPKRSLDVSGESKRAVELVASNRIYRQTAARNGDGRVAMLLADLEPVLVELAHAGDTLTPDKVTALQKRIESKGLLFKVRVVGAQTGGRETPALQKGTNSL
jgi:anti-sigma factor RsiW